MKKLIITLAAITALLTLTAGIVTYAAPTTTDSEPETVNITLEYRYSENEPAPQVPDTITRYGRQYRLLEKKDPVLESTLPITRTYTYKIDGNVSKDDLKEIENMPGIKITPVEVAMDREVDKKDLVKNLPNNDIEFLPLSKEFKVSSASNKNAVTEEQLKRAGVTYDITGYDSFGLPSSYTATIVYRGLETYKEIAYYKAVASYQSSEQVGTVNRYVVVATFEPVDLPTAAATETDEEDTEPVSETPIEPIAEPQPTQNIDSTDVPLSSGEDVIGLNPDDAAKLDEQTGNPAIDIFDGNVPLGGAGVKGAWSLLSALMTIASTVFCLFLIISTFFGRKKKMYDDASEKSIDLRLKKNMIVAIRTLAIVLCLMTIIVWLLLDEFGKQMVWVNQWTFVIAVFFIADLVLFILCLVKYFFSTESSEDAGSKERAA